MDSPKSLVARRKIILPAFMSGLVAVSVNACAGTSPAYIVHHLKAPAGLSDAKAHSRRSGQQLLFRQSKRGGFVNGQTEHSYPLTLSEGAVVRIELSSVSPGQDYDLFLVTEEGRELYFSRTLDNQDEFIETGYLEPGNYRVQVLNFNADSSTQAYRVQIEAEPSTVATASSTTAYRETAAWVAHSAPNAD